MTDRGSESWFSTISPSSAHNATQRRRRCGFSTLCPLATARARVVQNDFTADIVLLDGQPCAKVGRAFAPNPRLERVT